MLRREDGRHVRELDDPAGGLFDAAGDVDRLLELAQYAPAGGYRLLHYVDPDGNTMFNTLQMTDLLADIEHLLATTTIDIERRGLERLRVLAEACRSGGLLYLWFYGD
jgi:hypothetical protein